MNEIYYLTDGRAFVCRNITDIRMDGESWIIAHSIAEGGVYIYRRLIIPAIIIDHVEDLDESESKEEKE